MQDPKYKNLTVASFTVVNLIMATANDSEMKQTGMLVGNFELDP